MERSRPKVIVFRSDLLHPTEGFIRSQVEELKEFEGYYVGVRRVPGSVTPDNRTVVVNRGPIVGKVAEIVFKCSGFSPRLVSDCRRISPVLIHAHFGPDGIRALPLAEMLNRPLVVTFHGLDATATDEYAKRSFYSHREYVRHRGRLISRAALFIAVSEFVKKKLVRQGYPDKKLIVHYIGVDTRKFAPDRSIAREKAVLFVGRLIENKGCEFLIRAMAEVQRKHDWNLVVIGEGELRPKLQAMAHQMLKRCLFLGYQPQEKVREWMNRAQIFCLPSVEVDSGASEGFGIVLIEAQSMGLPVAGFATGGIPEAVADGESGILVPSKDPMALSTAIQTLIEGTALRCKFGTAARDRMIRSFNLEKQTRVLEGIYHDVANGKSTLNGQLMELVGEL